MASDARRRIEDGLYEKWCAWIERIYDETVAVFAYRSFYRGLVEMTQANDDLPPSSFFDALGAWYATTQAMAVRRQTDSSDDAVSIVTLLSSLATNSNVMSRARFVDLFDESNHGQRHAHKEYDRFAGEETDSISSERYQADRDRFRDTAKPIKEYVDRLVAHNDQRELTVVPTWEELNESIDLLEELLHKYMVLLKATGVPSADPVHQTDWRAPFRVAWLRD